MPPLARPMLYRAGRKNFEQGAENFPVHGGTEMKKIVVFVSASLGLAALVLPVGRAVADHVRVVPQVGVVYTPPVVVTPGSSMTVVPAPSSVTTVPGSVTVVPAPSTVVIPAPSTVVAVPGQQILRADQIRAHQVRATTIYANRIEADQVKGAIHHATRVRVDAPKSGEIVGPDVAASVIYADSIAANSIVADNVYVRDLEMSPARFVISPPQGAVVRSQAP
jgi:hypothetical protein